jgi:hypothetical protein
MEDKSRYLSQTRDFRIKNRSYSLKQIDGYNSKVMFMGSIADSSEGNGFGSIYSSL